MAPPGACAGWPRTVGVRAVCAFFVVLASLYVLCSPRLLLPGRPASSAPLMGRPLLRADMSARKASWDVSRYPAFLINGPDAYLKRKWAENQLAELGYTTYTRINAIWLDTDDCVNATKANCQEGLTLAHRSAWRRIAASTDERARGFLVLEDDVTFHAQFKTLFAQYADALPADVDVAYVGQLSRVTLDHDPDSKPLDTLIQSDVMPFTTHAYIIRRECAAFLANHLDFLLSRSGSPHATSAFYTSADAGTAFPWAMTALDLKARGVDFVLLAVHYYYFSRNAGGPTWFTFESTRRVPAQFGPTRWTKNGDMQLGHANAGKCAHDQQDYLSCEAPLPHNAPCGPSSGRLPLMGTGLAFQNQCRVNPFALYLWSGEPARASPPSCDSLRKRIAPGPDSEPTPADCMDEGAAALHDPALAAYFRLRDGITHTDELLFSVPGDGEQQPQNWTSLLTTTIGAAGSPWLDRSQPAAIIRAHGLPCAQASGRCDVNFWIRPGTTDAAVLGQVVASDEYHFLRKEQLPAPTTVLDAGGNCGIASILFANLFPSSRIITVEAEEENYRALHRNVDGRYNVEPIHAALWGEQAELDVLTGARHGREWDNERYNLQRFDFAKIDIEGAELQVFQGDTAWLAATSYVAVEIHEDMAPGATDAVFKALAAHATFCHTTSGEYNVWLNAATPLMSGLCATRAARGLDCCGQPLSAQA